ncbi:hypothetical protein GIB67_003676 [Kingdonia uniflora]|uniref:Uncharacterized protein n=1 Tax=Kingdonia uniflora TaxID=39325 RepID=A0A7J7M436_9MAGN|nr:hypothetical protein GIB67_003676 [Kingdonia uniflora]
MGNSKGQFTKLKTQVYDLTTTLEELVEKLCLANLAKVYTLMKHQEHKKIKGVVEEKRDEGTEEEEKDFGDAEFVEERLVISNSMNLMHNLRINFKIEIPVFDDLIDVEKLDNCTGDVLKFVKLLKLPDREQEKIAVPRMLFAILNVHNLKFLQSSTPNIGQEQKTCFLTKMVVWLRNIYGHVSRVPRYSPISFLERSATIYRDRYSVIYGDVKYTWNQSLQRCRKLAFAITQLGISHWDVVATLAPNIPEMYELYFAVLMVGAILFPGARRNGYSSSNSTRSLMLANFKPRFKGFRMSSVQPVTANSVRLVRLSAKEVVQWHSLAGSSVNVATANATQHSDGYIELNDRSKDIIISRGENINTIEVESILFSHPAVLDAAVVAQPDDHWGETPCAFVKLKDGYNGNIEEIIKFCRDCLPYYMAPRTIVFEDLPKTSTGKTQEFELREKAKPWIALLKRTATSSNLHSLDGWLLKAS